MIQQPSATQASYKKDEVLMSIIYAKQNWTIHVKSIDFLEDSPVAEKPCVFRAINTTQHRNKNGL